MNCFIMTCSPYNEGIEDLQREAEEREKDTGLSYLSQAAGFCSFHIIENVYHVNEPNFHPYLDIRLENMSSLTSN